MKGKLSLFVLASLIVLLLASCVMIEVTAARTHTESADSTNDTDPEETGITANGTEWLRITGTFDSSDDSDSYLVAVDSLTTLNLMVYHEGVEVLDSFLLGVNDFPISVVEYDANSNVLITNLAAASGTNIELEPDVDYIEVIVYANDQTIFGNPLPFTSGEYQIDIQ